MTTRRMLRNVLSSLGARLRGPSDAEILRRRLQAQIDAGDVEWGVGSYGYPSLTIYKPEGSDSPFVTVGRYCSFAEGIRMVVNGNHRLDWVTTYPIRERLELPDANRDGHPAVSGPIDIGNDVWIGEGALILGGVSIGDGAVIGAGSVVAQDVEPYAIVAGAPARLVRHRFPEAMVRALLEIEWWQLAPGEVAGAVDLLCAAPSKESMEELREIVRSRRSRT